jgi:addiction module RelE/StbE family toxin
LRIVWSPQARRDLREIYLNILSDNPAAARALHARIRASILRLADVPHLGRPGRVRGTRELVVTGTPYVVPYRVSEDTLQVLRVYHGARRWPEGFP